MKNKVVALLPMKANSERVKEKNFRDFNGKPLFRWMLDALLALEEVDLVVINTDAREILAKHGIVDSDELIIRDRRSEICGDLVSMNSVIADDVENVEADIFIMTHTTNPLLAPETIRAALAAYQQSRTEGLRDSLFTVNKMQSRFYRVDGTAVNHNPGRLIRTQDLEAWYEENSCLYIFSKESFKKTGARIGEKPLLFETPKIESIDIDGPDDWNIAKALGTAPCGEQA